MKFWEIVKGMCEGTYDEGNVFQNADLGDIVIENGVLTYKDTETPVDSVVGDMSDWEFLY